MFKNIGKTFFVAVLSVTGIGCAFAHDSPEPHRDILKRVEAKLGTSNNRLIFMNAKVAEIGSVDAQISFTGELEFIDLNEVSPNLWSKVSRIVELSEGAMLVAEVNMWHVAGIPNDTTAHYMIMRNTGLGRTKVNDQVKRVALDCGLSKESEVSVTLLEHDTKVDRSQGDGASVRITKPCPQVK